MLLRLAPQAILNPTFAWSMRPGCQIGGDAQRLHEHPVWAVLGLGSSAGPVHRLCCVFTIYSFTFYGVGCKWSQQGLQLGSYPQNQIGHTSTAPCLPSAWPWQGWSCSNWAIPSQARIHKSHLAWLGSQHPHCCIVLARANQGTRCSSNRLAARPSPIKASSTCTTCYCA